MTKRKTQKSLTTQKSYYNLHLVETQEQIIKDNKQKAAVYLVLNNINGNCYIGSAATNRINVRFRNHCVHKKNTNKLLNRAINKYGIEHFSFHILEYFPGKPQSGSLSGV